MPELVGVRGEQRVQYLGTYEAQRHVGTAAPGSLAGAPQARRLVVRRVRVRVRVGVRALEGEGVGGLGVRGLEG